MNDNNILACIEYAKQNDLACADEALEDYTNLRRQAWQEIEDWARSAGFVLVAERAGYIKAAQHGVQADALPGSLCCEYFRKTGYLHSEGCANYVRR